MKRFARVSLFVLVAMVLALAIGCKNDSQSDPAPDPKAKFIGTWMSPDGFITCKIEADKFTTTIDGEQPAEFTGSWSVDGDTVTTSEVTLPQEMGGGKKEFTMTMKAGESDVMDLPLGEMGGDQVLVKKTTTKSDLNGTWKGKVLSMAGMNGGTAPDATIIIEGTSATLTVTLENAMNFTGTLEQDGNFFTVNWSETSGFKLDPTTGLVSASGKAYLYDDSVFTKQ